MDEAIYTESAVFLLRGTGTPPFVHEPASWIRAGGRLWPLMIIPYVGATKAYATLPLFAAFGISTETARLRRSPPRRARDRRPLLADRAARRPAARRSSTALCLAIHPSVLDLTVFDNGGTAVQMGAMGLVALALARHLRRGSMRIRVPAGARGGSRGLGAR